MKPGDLIEWTYEQNGQLVIERETLWSTLMHNWVPIGSGLVHALISINSEQMCWLNKKGLFHARVSTRVWMMLQSRLGGAMGFGLFHACVDETV